MTDEQMARLRTHRNNIARYRRLLQTYLTDHEREFIERRMVQEQSIFESLKTSTFPMVLNAPVPPTHEAA